MEFSTRKVKNARSIVEQNHPRSGITVVDSSGEYKNIRSLFVQDRATICHIISMYLKDDEVKSLAVFFNALLERDEPDRTEVLLTLFSDIEDTEKFNNLIDLIINAPITNLKTTLFVRILSLVSGHKEGLTHQTLEYIRNCPPLLPLVKKNLQRKSIRSLFYEIECDAANPTDCIYELAEKYPDVILPTGENSFRMIEHPWYTALRIYDSLKCHDLPNAYCSDLCARLEREKPSDSRKFVLNVLDIIEDTGLHYNIPQSQMLIQYKLDLLLEKKITNRFEN